VVTWCNDEVCNDISILNGGQLTVSGLIEMGFNTQIQIEDGGELVIDAGIINHGNIIVKCGGKLTIINQGSIIQHNIDDKLNILAGGILDISSGSIQIE